MIKIKENNNFSFVTNSLSYEEVGTKSGKDYYVKGYISTDEIDRANEVVTRDAMKSMLEQIKSGNVKLDVEHSTFTGDNDIPVGKIVDAGIDNKGLWVKCTLNKSHSKFREVWDSIKNGFLDAFSIAYKTTEYVNDVVDGVNVTLLKGLELLNVAITGNPVCRGARMTESFYKSLKYLEEVNNMTDEKLKSEDVPENVEAPKEEATEEVKEEVKEDSKEEAPKEEETEVKDEEVVVEEKSEAESELEKEPSPLDEIKSLREEMASMKKENTSLKSSLQNVEKELKSAKKILEQPQLKGVAQTDIGDVKNDVEIKSPMQFIN